jgi:hypothetical protein
LANYTKNQLDGYNSHVFIVSRVERSLHIPSPARDSNPPGGFMQHFTQLNLQGDSQEKTSKPEISRKHDKATKTHFSRGQKIAAFLGSLAVTGFLGGLLLDTSGCSKANDKSHNVIAAPAVPPPAAASTMPVATPAIPEKPMPKKTRQHKLSASTYSNANYGVTFQYPRSYSLLEGEEANLAWTGLGPVEMNFAQPGGTTLSAVALPKGSFPGTNLSSAFFNVSVHSKLTANECEKFLFPQSKASASEASPKVEPARVKVGAAEFTEVQDSGGDPAMQADAKYYHIYQNGTCYEFMLGVETASNKITDNPVKSNEVFRKLNWMLSTVKIEPAGVPEKTVAKESAATAGAESKN